MISLKKIDKSPDWSWKTDDQLYVHENYDYKTMKSSAGSEADYPAKTGNNPRHTRWFSSDVSQQVRFYVEALWMKNHLFDLGKKREESGSNKVSSLLDLGCSRSYIYQNWRFNCNHFGWKPLDYWGVDANRKRVSQGRGSFTKKRRDRTVYFLADLVFPLNFYRKFDIVVCGEVIEHLPEKEQGVLLETVARHMHKDSIFIFSSPNPRKKNGEEFVSKYDHIYELSFDEMEKKLEKHGFFIQDACPIYARQGYKAHCSNKKLRDKLARFLPTSMVHSLMIVAENNFDLAKQYLIRARLQ